MKLFASYLLANHSLSFSLPFLKLSLSFSLRFVCSLCRALHPGACLRQTLPSSGTGATARCSGLRRGTTWSLKSWRARLGRGLVPVWARAAIRRPVEKGGWPAPKTGG